MSDSEAKEKQTSIILRDYTSNTFFNELNFKELNLSNIVEKNLKFNIFYKHKELSDYESISYNLVTALYYLQLKDLISSLYEKVNKKFYENFSHELKINEFNLNQHLLYSFVELDKINKLLNN